MDADPTLPGVEAPVHRALIEPILLAGAPRSLAIAIGTIAAALGLGLRLWLAGLIVWAIGHALAVWATRRDVRFIEVVRNHLRLPTRMDV